MSGLQRIMDRFGVDTDEIASFGVKKFLGLYSPDSVEFVQAENGFMIVVRTDEENTQKALMDWKENIQPHLEGTDE